MKFPSGHVKVDFKFYRNESWKVNTIGSKPMDSEYYKSLSGSQLKCELEKVREQVLGEM